MFDKRLTKLAPESKKHVLRCVFWKWLALANQICITGIFCYTFYRVFNDSIGLEAACISVAAIIMLLVIRFFFEKRAEVEAYEASVHIKGILRDAIYSKLLKIGVSYREKMSTSEVMQLSSEGVEQLEIYFGRYLPQLFYSLLAPITLFVVLSFVSIKAATVLLICVPLIPISIVFVQKIAKRLLSKYWGAYAELGDSFLENLQGLTTLKIYSADEMAAEKMDIESERFRKITMKVLMMQLNSTSVMDIIAYGGAAAGIIAAAFGYISGNIEFAGALMIILLSSEFFIPMRLLGSFFHIAMNGMAASEKMFRLLEMPEREPGNKVFPENEYSLYIDNMKFSYECNEPVLKDIAIETDSIGMYSFAGESGCGKSTLAGLLAGRNTGYEGEIRFGNTKLAEIDEMSLMDNVTLVKHDSYLFKGSVRYNLKFAKENATDEELIDVLKKVNLWNTLCDKAGLDTELSERGNNFSGGQCQRLVLARGLLKNSKVYIFDEITSSVDSESEETIMSVIKELSKEKLVILISHRLYNCIDSECIYYMKDGKIVGSGKHKMLLENCPNYRECFDKQKVFEDYSRKAYENGDN